MINLVLLHFGPDLNTWSSSDSGTPPSFLTLMRKRGNGRALQNLINVQMPVCGRALSADDREYDVGIDVGIDIAVVPLPPFGGYENQG